jgi:hypothetical protein
MANEEWVNDMTRVVGDQLMADIVRDNQRAAQRPALPTVKVEGAAPVATAPSNNGWVTPPSVKDWRAPGIDIIDRMVDAQDAIDRAARVRELGQVASALQKGKQE